MASEGLHRRTLAGLLVALLTAGAPVACEVDDDDVLHALAGSGGGGGDSGSGACTNDGDLTVLNHFGAEALIGIALSCSYLVCGQDDGCIATCMRNGDIVNGIQATGLSQGCSGCYGTFSVCATAHCGDDCAGDDAEECNECLAEYCVNDFCDCVGWDLCN